MTNNIEILFDNPTRFVSFGAYPYIRGIKYNASIYMGGTDRVYNFSEFWGMVCCYLYNSRCTISKSHFTNDQWDVVCDLANKYALKYNNCKVTII